MSDSSSQRTLPTLRFCMTHPAHFIALGFGTGLLTAAPGTVGTLAAIPLAMLLWSADNDAVYLAGVAITSAVGVWASGRTARDLGVADHGGIVIDEIAAFLLMLYFVGIDPVSIAYAFVLFRIFDIVKPPPIRVIDQRMKGGLGVMLDDFVAAAMALVVYALTVRLAGWPA